MRILMILYNQTGKGTFWRAYHLGRRLAQQGHSISLLAISPNSRFRFKQQKCNGVDLIETPDLFSGQLRSGWDPWDIIRRILWLKGKKFDLVHAFETRPVVLFPALALKRKGVKLVLDWCDWFGTGGAVEEREGKFRRFILGLVETHFEEHYRTRADGTTVINHFLKDRAIQLGVPPQSILLLRNGSDCDMPLLGKGVARQYLGIDLPGPLIGFVGGIYPRDAEFMALAFNEVLRVRPESKLLLVGYFNRDIEQWIDNPAAIIRTGFVSSEQLYTYLAACDIFWLPLLESGANLGRWPMKLNDYLVVGRPIVCTLANSELAELFHQNNIGLISAPRAEELAQRTLELLQDPQRLQECGRNARQLAETRFSWELMARRLEDFYLRVLSQ